MGKQTVEVLPKEAINRRLTDGVRTRLGVDRTLRVLDAGCGRRWSWDLEDINFHLTGIDADEEALRLRVQRQADLDEWYVGDLRSVELSPESYDVVHSAYVLEHILGAELVLERMYEALRPGGLMVIKIPDGHSVYGYLARVTPHWLHVVYKRRVRSRPLAGTPGHGPYPVVYDEVISLPGIVEWVGDHDMELVALYGENSHLHFFGRAKRSRG